MTKRKSFGGHRSRTSSKADLPRPDASADSRSSTLTRRGFAMGAVAAAATVGSAVAAPVKSSPRKWDEEADVIVVGSGCAGYTAAVTAAKRGARVLLVEKGPTVGGTTAKSGGVWWVPNNTRMREAGIADPRADAIKLMARLSYPARYNPDVANLGLDPADLSLIETFYDMAPVATDELDAVGALRNKFGSTVAGQKYPDYFGHFEENKAPHGRSLATLAPDGSSGMGGEMIRQLSDGANKLGVTTRTDHRVTDAFTNAKSEVIGVAAQSGDKSLAFRARKAVIFASGGFTHNTKLAQAHLLGPIAGGCAVPTNTGDFVDIAARLGAAFGNMTQAWWAETVFEQALIYPSVPTDVFYYPNGGMVLVNRFGNRVVNEKIAYNERAQVHFAIDTKRAEYTNYLLFMIYDQRVADDAGKRQFPYPMAAKGLKPPYIISGATLSELTHNVQARLAQLISKYKLGARLALDVSFEEGLKATVTRFNRFARTGVDLDFRRGDTEADRSYEPSAPNGMPNPTMYPIADKGPYHCIIIAPGTLDTKGGPKVNVKAQVLTPAGTPIAGLYGAGNCIASPSAQAYWSGGGTISPAITFGYLAGLNAVAETVKDA